MEQTRKVQAGGARKRVSGEELRRATFPQALRGYDREAVHAMLDRVADWVEGVAGAAPDMKNELQKVGERTAGILTAAEEAASKVRAEAKEYAEMARVAADEEARKARLNASQRTDQLIAGAEAKAEQIIDDAIARRRVLNQAISSLLERRDEIAGEAARLADELLDAVDELRAGDEHDERDEHDGHDGEYDTTDDANVPVSEEPTKPRPPRPPPAARP